MISVIVVTYNQEDKIARTLDSILAQQCHDDVVIMVSDDASTDGTADVCRDYVNRYPDRIRLNVNATNKGLVDNYFDTLLACESELIADCAGDDYWCDTLKLEKELRIMEAHPEVTLVHTAWVRRMASTGRLETPPPPPFTAPFTDGKDMLEAIITQTRVPVAHLCTALYRKSIFLKEYNGHRELFRNKLFGCEDLQIVFAMALHGKIAYLPDVTLHYTFEDGTVSNTGDSERQFRFVRSVSELSYVLSDVFCVKSQRINDYFSLRVYALLMHSFRACLPSLRSEALECQKHWGAADTTRIRILKIITAIPLLWKTALGVRRLVLKFK